MRLSVQSHKQFTQELSGNLLSWRSAKLFLSFTPEKVAFFQSGCPIVSVDILMFGLFI